MAEYIEREKTVELLRSLGNREYRKEKGTIQDAIKMISYPEYTPAADVAPVVHARWISWEEAGNFVPSPDRHECSVCHDAAQVLVNGFELLSDYCPNCGAKMDGGDSDAAD